ncbi:MAG: fimbrillin family protein [Bacteroides sp.]|nr:fimbrillin family protein [Bacteroides sp.]
MKIIKQFLFVALPVLLWVSCESDNIEEEDPNPVAVQFTSSPVGMSRAVVEGGETIFEDDDRIGIFMIAQGSTAIPGHIKEYGDNVEYKVDVTKQTILSPVGTPVYYPQNGDKVDFIAYYPYKPVLDNYTYPVDVSNQSNASQIDVLYSNNARNYGKGSGIVDLQFSHALSKLEVTVQAGTGTPSLVGLVATIEGWYQCGDLSLSDGITLANPQPGDIPMSEVTPGEKYEAILIPQGAVAGSKAIFTVGRDIYEWDLEKIIFEQGKRYTYTVTVNKTGITVNMNNISDWGGKDDTPTEGIGGIHYQMGDYYPDPKVDLNDAEEKAKIKGVVFWVDPADSRHGKVVALEENSGVPWSDLSTLTEVVDKDNGRANMATIKELSSDFLDYPAFEWVHGMNSSTENYSDASATSVWYLPAREELKALYNAYVAYGETDFNTQLMDAGGTAISSYSYWSSSEYDVNDAYGVSFNDGSTELISKRRDEYRVRPVLAF